MLFNRLFFVSTLVLLIAAALAEFIPMNFFRAGLCGGETFDALFSPNGSRVAEKRDCGSGENSDVRLFVRRNSDSEFPALKSGLRLNRGDSVGYVWADEQRLVVASPRPDDVLDRREHIGDVVVNYSLYSTTDPEPVRDPSAFVAVRRDIQARYRVAPKDVNGSPDLGCTLFVEADAMPELDTVKLRVTVGKYYRMKAWAAGPRTDMPEHISSDILFYAKTDYSRPISFVTSVALNDIEVEKNGMARDAWTRHRQPLLTSSGGLKSAWQIMWGLTESELQKTLDKLRAGQFEVRLGYWFDNKEFVYVNSLAGETNPIEEFAHCVRTNAIFPNLH
jgi:hypothetical protein